MSAILDFESSISLRVPGARPSTRRQELSFRVDISIPEGEGADVGIELLRAPRRRRLFLAIQEAVHAGLARAGGKVPDGGVRVVVAFPSAVSIPARVDSMIAGLVEGAVMAACHTFAGEHKTRSRVAASE